MLSSKHDTKYGFLLRPSGAETVIFWEISINTIAADARGPCVSRSSAAIALIMYYRINRSSFSKRKDELKPAVTSHC